MKTLPQFYVIKRDETNPLWNKYIDWINFKFGQTAYTKTESFNYLGYDGNYCSTDNIYIFKKETQLITLEYWNECVNGKTDA